MAHAVSLDLGLLRVAVVAALAAVFGGVPHAMAHPMSLDLVLGLVGLILRVTMVLVLRHLGSSCLLGEHENLNT
jgi:small basic protein